MQSAPGQRLTGRLVNIGARPSGWFVDPPRVTGYDLYRLHRHAIVGVPFVGSNLRVGGEGQGGTTERDVLFRLLPRGPVGKASHERLGEDAQAWGVLFYGLLALADSTLSWLFLQTIFLLAG